MKIKSFEPIANKNAKVLILGTMPGGESLSQKEYYADPSNHFWDIMFRILNEDYDFFRLAQVSVTYASKRQLLINNRIALWDTIKECERKGNLDRDIKDEIINDFETFLQEHKAITSIFFNGKGARNYFDRSVSQIVNKREINLVTLNSTSSSNRNNTFRILGEWKSKILEELRK
ncbi:MAG TPA: DNA-deoxyinosine glycosylase [Saprospiraceae bacterium]|nr:DNA-deoxyinosine glycosylase [Saprospiraceae bacterium]